MRQTTRQCVSVFFLMAALAGAGASPLLAQKIKVNSAVPSSSAQGTTLDVVVTGSGFKNGAKAHWFVTGTTNPGGVTVNSTAFNSGSQLTANITVADTATIGNFDIVVQNANGRTGKGTGLFSVTSSGDPQGGGCTTLGTPSGWDLVSQLNYVNASGAPQYGPNLGVAVSVRPVVLTAGTDSKTVLVAAVACGSCKKVEFFFLDPSTGSVLDNTVIVGTEVQPHLSVSNSFSGPRSMAAGDVNGDGIPDFVGKSPSANAAYVFVGSEDSNGILTYGPAIEIPAPSSNPGGFGAGIATGNLDGGTGDDVVVGAPGGGGGHQSSPGVVYIYRYNGTGFDLTGSVSDPLPDHNNSDSFGQAVAVGDVSETGTSLIVGAPNATLNKVKAAGRVFVFPSPLSSSLYYTLTTGISNDSLGTRVGAGHWSSSTATDVVATGSAPPDLSFFPGPITANLSAASSTFLADQTLAGGWATNSDVGDLNGDGWTDVVVGAPNASTPSSCGTSVGAAQLYLSNATGSGVQWIPTIFQPPTVQTDFMGFGFGVASVQAVPGVSGFTPLLVVGENGRDLGGVTGAGQVYVYKKQ